MAKGGCCKPRCRAKMSLEEYIQFFHSRNTFNIPVNHLNQIISMHGYKKLHKIPKTVVEDAVSTLLLISPHRSALNDISFSPMASITLDDVISDLNDLNWQECSTASVQTLSTAGHGLVTSSPVAPPPPTDSNQHHANCSNGKKRQKATGGNPKGARQRGRRPKRKRGTATVNGSAPECGGCLALDLFSIGSRC
ncbi:uncharacterized protein LOC133817385 [Humulus lupulus]|uniref:uncharacterized protein LOC133817385 n=1 Tax=Humulus lupulus TaxID=3486 RepID=UPI002B403918|nr:uncharacterized protein LOC133817385 [Humulus lupulus]